MSLYLLDTNIVSYYLRRSSDKLEKRLDKELAKATCAISAVTRAELRYGQSCMPQADRRRELIDDFLRQLPTLAWSRQAADKFGVLKAELRRVGRPIGDFDTQIAAHALVEGRSMITHNTKHFGVVEGLSIEDWAQ